jgi:hypothetical protein
VELQHLKHGLDVPQHLIASLQPHSAHRRRKLPERLDIDDNRTRLRVDGQGRAIATSQRRDEEREADPEPHEEAAAAVTLARRPRA